MITRRQDEYDDVLTNGKMGTRTRQHENEPSHAKDFGSPHEVSAERKKLIRWSYDGIR